MPDPENSAMEAISGLSPESLLHLMELRTASSRERDSDTTTYYTAQSEARTFYTAPFDQDSGSNNNVNARHESNTIRTPHIDLLLEMKLLPVDPAFEKNWSGRGQHVEFSRNEKGLVDNILQAQEVLGSSYTAIVQSVQCKRILLARKTIRCDHRMTVEEAIKEVSHLETVKHAHIVQIIGTYLMEGVDNMRKELSILIYPVARWNLEEFLSYGIRLSTHLDEVVAISIAVRRFCGCLSNALASIHQNKVKHMDIKPKNILVRPGPLSPHSDYQVYIADFGIARSYKSFEASETEGPTMFTRKYAAPEVVSQEKRGFAADIFSMGCVFAEIFVTQVFIDRHWVWSLHFASEHEYNAEYFDALSKLKKLENCLGSNEMGDSSYQANIPAVKEFLESIQLYQTYPTWDEIKEMTMSMLEKDPSDRPTASDLARCWGTNRCCTVGPEPLAAAPVQQRS